MIPKAGSVKNLKLVEEEIGNPKDNEVQIEVRAIGLNFADIFAIFGLYGATPEKSFVPGLEYSGVVKRIGGDVRSLKVGDKVMGITRFGGYTSCLNIEQEYVTPLPEGWNFDEGAAFLVQMLTAWWALIELGRIKTGDTVLIQSAAGGVGLWANRLAKNFDAYTIGCVGSDHKIDLLKREGFNDYIVRSSGFKKELEQKLDGRPLNIVLDSIGGRIFNDSYSLLSRNGKMVVYGSARYGQTGDRPNYLKLALKYFARPKIDPQKMIELNKAVLGFNLIYLYDMKEKLGEILADFKNYELGKPVVGHTFEFSQLKTAVKLFQTGRTQGKVVVRTGD